MHIYERLLYNIVINRILSEVKCQVSDLGVVQNYRQCHVHTKCTLGGARGVHTLYKRSIRSNLILSVLSQMTGLTTLFPVVHVQWVLHIYMAGIRTYGTSSLKWIWTSALASSGFVPLDKYAQESYFPLLQLHQCLCTHLQPESTC